MKIDLVRNNGIVTLIPRENITTANVNDLAGRIESLIGNENYNIAIDFGSKTDCLCAQAIGMFLSVSATAEGKGGGLYLLNVTNRLLSLFQISNIREKLNIFDSREDLERWVISRCGAAAKGFSPEKKGNILIVDDEKNQLELLRSFIEGEGYRTFLASDGMEAKVQMNRFPIDLILLDIRMPNMNGIEFMKIVKKEKRDVKVIIVTAHKSFEYAVEALRSRADDFLTKPYNPEELKERIRECLVK
ncbi:MAG: response regulator [Nitrospinae bacterium]|nr:response regulator [Nitrospinota bacterium]